jgi:Protein of unknown function (DUF1569)
MKNIFDISVTEGLIARINQLHVDTLPQWGKMNTARMFAHCSVAYDMVYTDKYSSPNAFHKFILSIFVKPVVVGNKPYQKNSMTAPEFIIKDDRDFETEKKRLIDNLTKTQKLGEEYFDNKVSSNFGVLTHHQWSTQFYKHLDHHLTQFGV